MLIILIYNIDNPRLGKIIQSSPLKMLAKELVLPVARIRQDLAGKRIGVTYKMDAEAVSIIQAKDQCRELGFASLICLTLYFSAVLATEILNALFESVKPCAVVRSRRRERISANHSVSN